MRKRFFVAVTTMILVALADPAGAGSIGDFLKDLGRSISHPEKNRKSKSQDSKKTVRKRPKTKANVTEADYPPEPAATPLLLATPTATIQQVPVRVASLPAQNRKSKRDIPYAIPVPNKPGFVTSPYAPKQGLVDVRDFPSGTEVIDPYTGKTFLTP